MITGFNPGDMYRVDHTRRVLKTFPGVFTGIGEFSIHKEFVSAKISGETASLTNPALDRILDFAVEVGLVVLIHNDIDMPFARQNTEPAYLSQMKALLLFGTDTVAPAGAAAYFAVFEMWQPVWRQLTPETSLKVLKTNNERIFNEGRRRVREWERANAK